MKYKPVVVNPDWQIIRTVTRDNFIVDAKYVEEISTLIKILEDAGLQVYGDGIHSLKFSINGVQLGYQLASTNPLPNLL